MFLCFGSWNFEFMLLVNFVGQSFSAVVGPNGSGKSNVIDAMLFVFGKRAKQVLSPKFIPFFLSSGVFGSSE